MATVFHLGPWGYASLNGMPPGAEHHWWHTGFAYGDVVQVTAHPIHRAGREGHMSVTRISSHVSPTGGRTIFFTVRNVGNDPTNYAVFISWIRS